MRLSGSRVDSASATGFIHNHDSCSSQQDVVIYPASAPPLFRMGDLVVVENIDKPACIEVKTTFRREYLDSLGDTRARSGGGVRVGLFAFQRSVDGSSLVTPLFEAIRHAGGVRPDAIMIDRKCVLVARQYGTVAKQLYFRLDLDDENVGLGFLLFVHSLIPGGDVQKYPYDLTADPRVVTVDAPPTNDRDA
jgi:hypothetical protein